MNITRLCGKHNYRYMLPDFTEKQLQVLVVRLAQKKFHSITAFIADGADDILGSVHHMLVYTEDADIFLPIEQRRLHPSNIEGDALFQQSLLDQILTVRIGYLTEFDFIMYFQGRVQWLIHFNLHSVSGDMIILTLL